MLEFNYSIAEDDYLRFNTHHVLNTDVGKKALKTYRFTFIVISLCMLLIVAVISRDLTLIILEAVLLGILLLIWLLLSNQNYLNAIKRKLTSMKKKNIPLPYSEESKLSFGDESFTDFSNNIATTYNYAIIEFIWVTPTDIYIYINAVSAIIIPFTAFSSVDEINSLIGFLATKVDHSKFKSSK